MYYTNDTQSRYGGQEQRTMRAQQEREARRRLTEEFVELLCLRPEDGAQWTGTLTDLMEVVHIAYEQGTVRGDDGRAGTFRGLARHICTVLNMTPPDNPRTYATRAAQRKGVREEPFIDRYTWLLFQRGVEHPLMASVRL